MLCLDALTADVDAVIVRVSESLCLFLYQAVMVEDSCFFFKQKTAYEI